MKKTLIALAVLTVSGAAFAQSTATISGTYGVAYQSHKTNAVAAKAAGTANTTGIGAPGAAAVAAVPAGADKGLAMTDSSIRVAVTEDLGGGLRASGFVQFAGNASRGGNVTKEDSSLALSGGFGSIAISNTRSGDTAIAANVFASWMPRTAFYDTVSSRAAGDLVAYTLPTMVKGLTLGVSQFEATEGTTTSAVKANIISGSYAAGPLSVAFASKTASSLTAAQITAKAKKTNTELAVTYNLGVANVGFGYDSKTTDTGKALTSYGISVPMGAMTIGVNGAKRGTAKFTDAGINYALSKRSTVSLMTGDMTGGSREGNQYRIGLLHKF